MLTAEDVHRDSKKKQKTKIRSFIFSQGRGGSRACPRNGMCEAGIHPGWVGNLLNTLKFIHTCKFTPKGNLGMFLEVGGNRRTFRVLR